VRKGLHLTLLLLIAPLAIASAQPTKRHMISYAELTAASAGLAAPHVAYGSDPLQYGELRLPAGDVRVPLVVFIHGGCWLSGYNLDHTRALTAALAREGYAVWSPEYRRIGDAGGGWPGTFDDIALAVDHVRELARANPRIDTSRVVIMGHSAGGQLAVWAASRAEPGAFPVRGAVSLAGILDMARYGAASGSCNASVYRLLGGSAQEQPERYKAVDPILRTPVKVPVRIVHGEEDTTVPIDQSRAFVEKSRTVGGLAELEAVPGAAHFDVVAPQGDAWLAVRRALRAIVLP
jgi:acetyl esterase/lipase